MKTFISDLIPKIQRYSQKIDNLTLLTNQHWVVIGNLSHEKYIYIFRENNDLLISKNGKVEKAKWEYLGNYSILIDLKDESYLFKQGFFDENILALKVDSKEEYVFMVNENKFFGELNSFERIIEFLKNRYIDADLRKKIFQQTEIKKMDFDVISTNVILFEGVEIEYFIGETEEKFDLIWGSYFRTLIHFSDGSNGYINKGNNSGKYFFLHIFKGRKYVESKEDCIKQLYYSLNEYRI